MEGMDRGLKRADSSAGSGALEHSTPVSKETTSIYSPGADSTLDEGDPASKANVIMTADEQDDTNIHKTSP